MIQNGSGSVTVTITADAQLVQQAPGLAADLHTDDLTAAGWQVTGPVGTGNGGLSMELVHPFDTPGQATALVASLNGPDGPFEAVSFTRDQHTSEIEYRMDGRAKVDGLTGFADADLIDAVGATPYDEEIEAADLSPDEAVGLTFTVDLPGRVDETTSGRVDEPLEWEIPFDDTVVDLTVRSTASLERGRNWTVLATLSFVALGLWALISVAFIIYIARRQHHRRKRRRSLDRLADLEVRDDFL